MLPIAFAPGGLVSVLPTPLNARDRVRLDTALQR